MPGQYRSPPWAILYGQTQRYFPAGFKEHQWAFLSWNGTSQSPWHNGHFTWVDSVGGKNHAPVEMVKVTISFFYKVCTYRLVQDFFDQPLMDMKLHAIRTGHDKPLQKGRDPSACLCVTKHWPVDHGCLVWNKGLFFVRNLGLLRRFTCIYIIYTSTPPQKFEPSNLQPPSKPKGLKPPGQVRSLGTSPARNPSASKRRCLL